MCLKFSKNRLFGMEGVVHLTFYKKINVECVRKLQLSIVVFGDFCMSPKKAKSRGMYNMIHTFT